MQFQLETSCAGGTLSYCSQGSGDPSEPVAELVRLQGEDPSSSHL